MYLLQDFITALLEKVKGLQKLNTPPKKSEKNPPYPRKNHCFVKNNSVQHRDDQLLPEFLSQQHWEEDQPIKSLVQGLLSLFLCYVLSIYKHIHTQVSVINVLLSIA